MRVAVVVVFLFLCADMHLGALGARLTNTNTNNNININNINKGTIRNTWFQSRNGHTPQRRFLAQPIVTHRDVTQTQALQLKDDATSITDPDATPYATQPQFKKILYPLVLIGVALTLIGFASFALTGRLGVGYSIAAVIRIVLVPVAFVCIAIYFPSMALAPELSDDRAATNAQLVQMLLYGSMIVLAVSVVIVRLLHTNVLNNAVLFGVELHSMHRRPLHMYMLLMAVIVFAACATPVLGFLQGRVSTENNSLLRVRISILVLSWISAALSILLFIYSLIQEIASKSSLPAPQLFQPDVWDLMSNLVTFSTSLAAFLEYTRAVHGHNAVCSKLEIENRILEVDGGATVFFGGLMRDANGTDTFAAGMSCDVECSNGFRTQMDCFDYGLIGGRWAQLEEGTFDSLMSVCAIKSGCNFAKLSSFVTSTSNASRTNCPASGIAPIRSRCLIECAGCNTVQTTAICKAYTQQANATAVPETVLEWSMIYRNSTSLGCPSSCPPDTSK